MTVQGHAGGYRVQTSAMDSEAQTLDKAGDDVGAIARAVKDTACYTLDVLGGSDAGPAYNNFAGDWQAEAKVLESALHELADKVRVSKANYQGAEHASIRGMSAASGEGVTTMPAPAGDVPVPGHRTMPAPGTPPRGLSDFG
ncbi:WXG100 family type VII secretion target [Streptomyces sp. DT2A-34]|uniref:WXG100 family type VII secretion target n=1 Tax=Streptomyces sp. DT2A-34 TaxID=3051182 RepID=UPI00265C3141|nr:WXG100 family type VII secretion target [Streptomyces sp. DT2A-34]MDO0909379.1 WXG100 family type VII secretion target [Streptomyces sp. DT2A-34]